MKYKTPENSKNRTLKTLTRLILQLNDFETTYPDEFLEFVSHPTIQNKLKVVETYRLSGYQHTNKN